MRRFVKYCRMDKGTPGKFDWKNLGVCTLRALPSLSLIIVVIGGIIGGVFSATEGSAIAVVYALVLAFCLSLIHIYATVSRPALEVVLKMGSVTSGSSIASW